MCKGEIQAWIDLTSEILQIDPPKLKKLENRKDTLLARYIPATDIIEVKNRDCINVDSVFAIAHEMRHKWQIVTDEEYWFSGYSNNTKDINKYNRQKADVDANAFAMMVLATYLKFRPLFKGLNKKTIQMIKDRVAYLDENGIFTK